MATADLGIRISLQDTASGGFASLGANLLGLSGVITRVSTLWNSMSVQQQAVAAGVAAAGITYHEFSDALGDVINAAGDLQASMIQVGINVKGANDRTQDMLTTLTNLADYSIFSSQEVADGFVLMGQKGYTAADIIDNQLGKSMVDLAEAVNSQVVPAGLLLSSAMQTWHADAKEGAYYASALSFAFHNGIPDVAGLQQAIMQAGAQAVDAKIPFKEFVLMLDELGKSGLSGSQAATSLRYMIASLLEPTNKAAQEMANLGVITVTNTTPALQGLLDATNALEKNPLKLTGTLSDLNALYTAAKKVGTLHTDQSFIEWATGINAIKNNLYDANGNFQGLAAVIDILGPKLASLNTSEDFNMAIENLFNVRGGKGASALLNDLGFTTDQIKKMSAAYDDYIKKDGARQAAVQTTSGWNAILKELGSTAHSAEAQIGMPLLGALSNIGTGLNNLLNNVRTTHPQVLSFVGLFLVFGTALSGIALVVGLVVAAIALFGAPLAVIGMAIGAIIGFAGTLAGVFLVVKDHWSQITGVANGFLNALKPVASFLGTVFGGLFKDLGEQLHHFGGIELGAVGKMISTFLLPSLKQLGTAFGELWNMISPVVKIIGILVGAILGFVVIVVGALTSGILFGAVHGLMALFSSIVVVISGVVTAVSGILQIFVGIFKLVGATIKFLFTGNFDELKRDVLNALGDLGHGAQSVLSGLMQFIVGFFTGLLGAPFALLSGFVSGVLHFFSNLETAVEGVFRRIMGGFQSMMSNIKNIPGVGGLLTGQGPLGLHIPGLAAGGLVTSPTLALIGEGREPEVVLPVSKLAAFMDNYKAAGQGMVGGGTIVVPLVIDGTQVAGVVVDRITGQVRQMGAGRMFR